jgi:hypothetical protein
MLTRMSNTLSSILAILNTPAFDKFRAQIVDYRLKGAQAALERYCEAVKAHDHTNHRPNAPVPPRIPGCVILPKNCTSGSYYELDLNRYNAVIGGAVVLNRAKVISDANQEWEDTKAFYAHRVAEKIEIYLKGDVEIALNLTSYGVLEGSCTAVEGDKVLVLDTQLKTNYRYGENAADGNLTIYRQVPTTVRSAKGFDPIALETAAAQGAQQAKVDRKAALEAAQQALRTAEKRKDLIDRLHSLKRWEKTTGHPLRNGNLDDWNTVVAKSGLTGDLSLAGTKALLLSARTTVKEAKAKLKAIREAK